MAIDHFIKHRYSKERVNWTFHLLFNDQPQVAELARQYAPLIKHPGLYKPVPAQWLHGTVLRVGFLEDFTEAEMLAVADHLEPRLANMKMPELTLGQRYWLWNGGPALSITPRQPLQEMFGYLMSSLAVVVGRHRLPALSSTSERQLKAMVGRLLNTFGAAIGRDRLPAMLQFMPHVTLAYPKTHNDERSLHKRLRSHPIDGVKIRANRLSLIKQYVEDDYYAWEIVKELPIGQLIKPPV